MSRIRNKGTKPEVTLRKALFARGFRYRVNVKTLPGNRTSFCLDTRRSFSFMDVSGTDIPVANMHTLPRAIRNFGVNKISGNQERDGVVKRELEEFGWKVIIVWECEIRHGKDFAGLIDRVSVDVLTQ